jgi:hypothetical protein
MTVMYEMRFTGSQKMALVDALLELLLIPHATQLFVDCSKDPPVETNVTELVRLVQYAKPIAVATSPEPLTSAPASRPLMIDSKARKQ